MRDANKVIPLKKKRRSIFEGIDFILVFTITVLLLAGLLMMFSASSAANMMSGKVYYQFVKQLIVAAAGVVFMFLIAAMDYRIFRPMSGVIYIIIQVLMFIVPVIGPISHGAKRQINLVAGFNFQPSELSKYAMILMLAAHFAVRKAKKIDDWRELFTTLLIVAIPVGACFLQSHGSAALLHVLVGMTLVIASGVNFKKLGVKKVLLICVAAVVLITLVFVMTGGYRMDRIENFVDGILGNDTDSQGLGWQSKQSVYAVGSGGLFGLGLGNSRQKYSYLPEAENDYIFAIVCEELGFVGALGVIVLFCVLVWRGVVVAINCKDKFGSYLAFGISVLIGFQVLINMSVVLQIIPSTGMQLPLFSSGGTSLFITLMGFGALLSVSRHTKLNEI